MEWIMDMAMEMEMVWACKNGAIKEGDKGRRRELSDLI
jgi:hypothetical protein